MDSSVCPIFIGSEGRIDTSAHEPNSQFATVLRVLEVCLPFMIDKVHWKLTWDVDRQRFGPSAIDH
jgi:hypothetical protein